MILMARHAYEGFCTEEGAMFMPEFSTRAFDEDDGWITIHVPAGLHIYRVIEIGQFTVLQILWTIDKPVGLRTWQHGWLDVPLTLNP